jgi:hypothetical protein
MRPASGAGNSRDIGMGERGRKPLWSLAALRAMPLN